MLVLKRRLVDENGKRMMARVYFFKTQLVLDKKSLV